jgi:nucleotide-binding universal stress UspA family protein
VVEFKRILCPIDLSDLSVRTLAYANAIASWYDARLTALHVVPSFTPMDVRTGLALRANIAETILLAVFSEQGEKKDQREA